MCMGQDAPEPKLPPTPPPPPPVLEQAAPDVAAPKASDTLKNKAQGTKQYRSSLSIGTASQSTNNMGLGINS